MRINLEVAIKKLKEGEVIAIPTETVYGLAASLKFDEAVEQVFKIKGRPSQNPLIIHVGNSEQVSWYVKEYPPLAQKLMSHFWPGSLTLVLPVLPNTISPRIRADLPTAAFRMPQHPLTLELLQATGPLVAPSANLSGRPSATQPDHIEMDFGALFPILDGGVCNKGVESTILGFAENRWQIYRLGAIPPKEFEGILGYIPEVTTNDKERPLCPGQLFQHYAPKARLHLEKWPKNVPVVIGFSDRKYQDVQTHIRWGNNAQEIAHELYDTLRRLDLDGIEEAWIDIDFSSDGLWKTILERLQKAQG